MNYLKYKTSFFTDKHGRIVLWQTPNLLLAIWIVCRVIAIFLSSGRFKTGLEQVGTAAIFAWAYLEATKGVNYFRKALGVLVLAVVIIGFFS